MKALAADIRPYFVPVIGLAAWRVPLGYGSFITFEFGQNITEHGFEHGEWHLWIYLATWVLNEGDRRLVDSDSDRDSIAAALPCLENRELTDVELADAKTRFTFGEFSLNVSPADYLGDADATEDHEYWLFFMPDNQVVTLGTRGLRVGRSDEP